MALSYATPSAPTPPPIPWWRFGRSPLESAKERFPAKHEPIERLMATLPSPPPELTPEQLYLGHLKLIDEVAKHAAQRRHFSREECEDFVSTVRFKLLDDDYKIIRLFRGTSTFKTYLTIVVSHQMLDYQNHHWGKWRPSAEAKRLGHAAVRLDVLLHREGLSLDEACEILRTNEGVELSHQELAELAARLPPHNPPRRMQGEEEVADRPAEGEAPDERVLGLEAAKRKQGILEILCQLLALLSDEDRLIVRMLGEFKVVQISKTLNLEQKPLYRRIEKILKGLRNDLEKHGVSAEVVAEILFLPEREFDVWR
jgi:RNA polymerase sigma factor (sigma-70 family)